MERLIESSGLVYDSSSNMVQVLLKDISPEDLFKMGLNECPKFLGGQVSVEHPKETDIGNLIRFNLKEGEEKSMLAGDMILPESLPRSNPLYFTLLPLRRFHSFDTAKRGKPGKESCKKPQEKKKTPEKGAALDPVFKTGQLLFIFEEFPGKLSQLKVNKHYKHGDVQSKKVIRILSEVMQKVFRKNLSFSHETFKNQEFYGVVLCVQTEKIAKGMINNKGIQTCKCLLAAHTLQRIAPNVYKNWFIENSSLDEEIEAKADIRAIQEFCQGQSSIVIETFCPKAQSIDPKKMKDFYNFKLLGTKTESMEEENKVTNDFSKAIGKEFKTKKEDSFIPKSEKIEVKNESESENEKSTKAESRINSNFIEPFDFAAETQAKGYSNQLRASCFKEPKSPQIDVLPCAFSPVSAGYFNDFSLKESNSILGSNGGYPFFEPNNFDFFDPDKEGFGLSFHDPFIELQDPKSKGSMSPNVYSEIEEKESIQQEVIVLEKKEKGALSKKSQIVSMNISHTHPKQDLILLLQKIEEEPYINFTLEEIRKNADWSCNIETLKSFVFRLANYLTLLDNKGDPRIPSIKILVFGYVKNSSARAIFKLIRRGKVIVSGDRNLFDQPRLETFKIVCELLSEVLKNDVKIEKIIQEMIEDHYCSVLPEPEAKIKGRKEKKGVETLNLEEKFDSILQNIKKKKKRGLLKRKNNPKIPNEIPDEPSSFIFSGIKLKKMEDSPSYFNINEAGENSRSSICFNNAKIMVEYKQNKIPEEELRKREGNIQGLSEMLGFSDQEIVQSNEKATRCLKINMHPKSMEESLKKEELKMMEFVKNCQLRREEYLKRIKEEPMKSLKELLEFEEESSHRNMPSSIIINEGNNELAGNRKENKKYECAEKLESLEDMLKSPKKSDEEKASFKKLSQMDLKMHCGSKRIQKNELKVHNPAKMQKTRGLLSLIQEKEHETEESSFLFERKEINEEELEEGEILGPRLWEMVETKNSFIKKQGKSWAKDKCLLSKTGPQKHKKTENISFLSRSDPRATKNGLPKMLDSSFSLLKEIQKDPEMNFPPKSLISETNRISLNLSANLSSNNGQNFQFFMPYFMGYGMPSQQIICMLPAATIPSNEPPKIPSSLRENQKALVSSNCIQMQNDSLRIQRNKESSSDQRSQETKHSTSDSHFSESKRTESKSGMPSQKTVDNLERFKKKESFSFSRCKMKAAQLTQEKKQEETETIVLDD